MTRGFASRRGTSLLEVMASVTVLVIMMAATITALRSALDMRDILEERDDSTRGARVALERIRREIQLAFLTPNRTSTLTYQTVFVGEDGGTDQLWFASLSHQRLYRDTRESDQTEISIWAEPDPDGVGYVLYHREAPRIDEEPDKDGTVLALARGVRSFELRYLDSQADEWREEWDSRGADTPYRLPRAVSIGLVLIGTDPEDPDRTIDLPFFTTVLLQYADGYRSTFGTSIGGTGPTTVGPTRTGSGRTSRPTGAPTGPSDPPTSRRPRR